MKKIYNLMGVPREKYKSLRWFRKRWLTRRNPAVGYLWKLRALLLEAVFLLLAIWALSFILLFVADLFWHLYLETMMGREFCLSFPKRAEQIEQLLDKDLMVLSGRITLSAFFVSLAIAAVGRVTHINRHFYMSLGIIGKLAYWGLPVTAVTAYYIHKEYAVSQDFGLTLLMAAIPTYCLFMSCFYYTEKLLPEAEDVLGFGYRLSKKVREVFHKMTRPQP
ncbi:MAG TPA: hypothetical protein VKO20_02060 [Desulfosalsimonadaceae bacterium]|nr:hypothetical protein [Desulfosalsimonadaceae bacterium]